VPSADMITTIISEGRCRQPSCALNVVVNLGLGFIRIDAGLDGLWDIWAELFFQCAQGCEERSTVKESLWPSRILIRELGEISISIEHVWSPRKMSFTRRRIDYSK